MPILPIPEDGPFNLSEAENASYGRNKVLCERYLVALSADHGAAPTPEQDPAFSLLDARHSVVRYVPTTTRSARPPRHA